MPVEYFLRYKGQCYDVGTRLKVNLHGCVHDGSIEWISHNHIYIRFVDGTGRMLSKVWPLDNTIIEIIEPVYYVAPQYNKVQTRNVPSINDIFIGWVWYIAIMLIGVIFNGRWLIWTLATIVFFSWKNGGIKK